MGFSRQEYWSGLPFPPQGDLPNSGMEPVSLASPASAGGFFTTGTPGKPLKAGLLSYHVGISGSWFSLSIGEWGSKAGRGDLRL